MPIVYICWSSVLTATMLVTWTGPHRGKVHKAKRELEDVKEALTTVVRRRLEALVNTLVQYMENLEEAPH
jgi:hypothetical protein